jgi:hypothetical protein
MLISKIFSPSPIFAQTIDDWSTGNRCAVDGIATIKGFECLFQNILQIIFPIAGLVFFIMFLIGGFKYLTSSGDNKKAAAASSTLTMSIFGIIGVIVSYLILLFIQKFTGVEVTQFNMGP